MIRIHQYIESTNLSPTVTGKAIDTLVAEAKSFHVLGVCVPPFWVKRAAREAAGSDLKVVTVIGYPLGYQMTEAKLKECEMAVKNGAHELDLVMNLSAFNDQMDWVKIEMAKIAKYAHEHEVLLKVIIEIELWDENQLLTLLTYAKDAGVDFVKTSTGFHRTPVNIKTVQFLRRNLPSTVGIKASGGINDSTQARMLIEAGADRLGTSSAVKILSE